MVDFQILILSDSSSMLNVRTPHIKNNQWIPILDDEVAWDLEVKTAGLVPFLFQKEKGEKKI